MSETDHRAPTRRMVPRLASATAIPLYEQVKRQISEMILCGSWPPGFVLPNEHQLAVDLNVAVGTVRRAMQDLVSEGLLMRRRKTGTVVTGRAPHHSMRFFFQYFRLHDRDGSLLTSDTVTLAVAHRSAGTEEQRDLSVGPATEVVEIKRIRLVRGRRVMHERQVIAAERVPDLPERDALPPLLYLYLLERYGIRISMAREVVQACGIGDEDRAHLDISDAAAVLQIHTVAYDQSGMPTIVATHRCLTDELLYINEVR